MFPYLHQQPAKCVEVDMFISQMCLPQPCCSQVGSGRHFCPATFESVLMQVMSRPEIYHWVFQSSAGSIVKILGSSLGNLSEHHFSIIPELSMTPSGHSHVVSTPGAVDTIKHDYVLSLACIKGLHPVFSS